jgi:nucleoside-diphosphate-sugar epimerase
VVVNLAAELKDERYFESTHIEGVKNIISLSERHAVKKIIHLSSVGVVGMQFSRKPVLVNETFPCHPLSGYERTKLRSEELFAAWRDRKNTTVHILRPTNVFGDQHPRRALEGFFTRVRKGSNMPSASNAVVNYVYVKDVAHVIRHLLLNDGLPGLMNVGTSMSFEEFVCMAAARLGSGSRVKAVPAAFLQAGALAAKLFSPRMHIALRALMNRVEYDDSLLRKYTGYKYGIEKGIDAAATFYGL